MSNNKPSSAHIINRNWTALLPILLMAPLAMAPKGCDSAVVGNDCPDGVECAGSAGSAASPGNAGNGSAAAGSGSGIAGNGSAAAGNGSGTAGSGAAGPGATCGGLLGVTCDKGEFCDFEPATKCGDGDQTGTCKVPPQVCDDLYSPVCGCDGKTYPNDCEAAAKGISVLSNGTCDGVDPGTQCGGLKGIACDKGYFCNFPPETTCGNADQFGKCTAIPGACDALYDPVCGCDGKTYGNDCTAALAGVSVAKAGVCASGKACGGITGAPCDKGEYCNYSLAAACGGGDMQGTCAATPTACTKEQNPVCGCDGTAYGNPCMAAAAGTSISPGKCK